MSKNSHVSLRICAYGGVIPWCPLDIINHWLWERNWANNVPSRQELVSRAQAIKIITHLTIGDTTRARDTRGNVTVIRAQCQQTARHVNQQNIGNKKFNSLNQWLRASKVSSMKTGKMGKMFVWFHHHLKFLGKEHKPEKGPLRWLI